MKRIEYENIENCENEYLKILLCPSSKKNTEPALKILQTEWNRLRNKYAVLEYYFPKKVTKLFVAPFRKIISYTIRLSRVENIKEARQLRNEFDDNCEYKFIFKFEYDKFSERIATFFKENADKLKIHSCFYCDAAYAGVYSTENKDERTFDVDHFFPKSKYPIFCLSLYNFIPSCQICNSRIKNDKFIELFFQNTKMSKYDLLHLSPASKNYDVENNLTIKVYPQNKELTDNSETDNSETDNDWHYTPVFSKYLENYKIFFDVKENSPEKKSVEAFKLQERYNNIAIKSQALYLMDLKRKYPDSNIKMISNILISNDKTHAIGTFNQIKNAIFHKDNKYALLQKMRNDIIDSDIIT